MRHCSSCSRQALLLLAFTALVAASGRAHAADVTAASVATAKEVSRLLSSDGPKMIVSAAGDACLDAGVLPSECWNRMALADSLSNPWCSSLGVVASPGGGCAAEAWNFFSYDGMLSFGTGWRGLGQRKCLQAWACNAATESSPAAGNTTATTNSSSSNGSSASGTAAAVNGTAPAVAPAAVVMAKTPECDVRGAPCNWGGPQYQAFFTGDPAGRTARSGYPMFMIHFANKGSSWCLTNAAEAGGAAKLRPCDGSDSQLWFVPQW